MFIFETRYLTTWSAELKSLIEKTALFIKCLFSLKNYIKEI